MPPEAAKHHLDPSRIIALVGRPNVGKSALFNRIAGRKIAIVHAQSGVTRDRLMRTVELDGERFDLIDTGGLVAVEGRTQDVFEKGIRGQAEAAIMEAAVVLMVTDVTGGLTPMDEAVADLLRKSGQKVLLLANKADSPEWDDAALDFSRLGFPVTPVSALQGRGLKSVMASALDMLPDVQTEGVERPLRVAVIGRPNVGKSSYINSLLRNERVLVTEHAGTTRDSVDVPFSIGSGKQARHYVLVDTAGIRRAGKVRDTVERFGLARAEKAIRGADVCLLLLDGQTGPTAQDKKIAARVIANRKGCVIAVNKWDLVKGRSKDFAPVLQKMMPFMGHCPVGFMSAVAGRNVRYTLELIDHVAGQVNRQIPTGILNRALQNAVEKVNAPVVKNRRRLKLFYATQTGVAPPSFRVFVNDPQLVVPAYHDYLIRKLREKFGLEGAVIVLNFKARSESKDKERTGL